MNANTTTAPPDLYARLVDEGDFYLVHPITDKGRAWFAETISDGRGFTYVRQRDAYALAFKRATDAGVRMLIDCGTGAPPAELAKLLPANIAQFLRTANQRIPLLPLK